MATIGSCEAKTHLPALLERVQKGEQITITRHGTPIAMLVPATPVPAKPRPQVIADLKSFRKGRSLPRGMRVRDLIEKGRRF